MTEFQYPYLLFAYLLIPLFALIYVLVLLSKKKKIDAIGDHILIGRLMPNYSAARSLFKFILLMLAFMALVFGAANLRIGSELDKKKREGVDIVIALDISNSMLARDIKPDRLERAKLALVRLIDEFEDDQIAIVVFAGRARVLLPITTDYTSAKNMAMSAGTDMIPEQGTAIGEAIHLAATSFNANSKNNKAIIVITDGENHEDDAVAAAAAVHNEGIPVHVIGIGSPQGSPIPVESTGFNVEFKKDKQGNTVVTRINEPMMQQIAMAGGGTYVRATTGDAGLKKIFDVITKMDKKEYEAKTFTSYKDTFLFFISLAMFFLLIETIIFERKTSLSAYFRFVGKQSYFQRLNHESNKEK